MPILEYKVKTGEVDIDYKDEMYEVKPKYGRKNAEKQLRKYENVSDLKRGGYFSPITDIKVIDQKFYIEDYGWAPDLYMEVFRNW